MTQVSSLGPDFLPHEVEVFDDIEDLVREERRKRFRVGDSHPDTDTPYEERRYMIRQLRHIAKDPHFTLLQGIYEQLADLGEKILNEKIDGVNPA